MDFLFLYQTVHLWKFKTKKERNLEKIIEFSKKIFQIKGGFHMLKATGVVRKVDGLGRIVIPMEIRQAYDIKEKDSLEIFIDGGKIVLRKYEPACIFCNNAENVTDYHGKLICKTCLKEINKEYAK